MGQEAYCTKHFVGTYNGKFMNGGKSMGGYSLYNRSPARFVIPIPDAIPSAEAAPMLCGGVTVYNPLKNNGAGPGKKVGVIGVGGLGHFAVLFGKALGADKVVAISRKKSKADDALKLGADQYIATDDDADWVQDNAKTLDLIICTVSSSKVCSPDRDYARIPADGVEGRCLSANILSCSALEESSFKWAFPMAVFYLSLFPSSSVVPRLGVPSLAVRVRSRKCSISLPRRASIHGSNSAR
jgi:threonine dehydrogenase-like Zn-dependent dehydrogenase